MSLFSFRGKNTNTVWPSLASIASRANIADTPRISRLTSSLAKKGWLTKKKRGFTGGNEYVLTVPERLANLDSEAKLSPDDKLDGDDNSNLYSDDKSNLSPDDKCKEEYKEQTKEDPEEHPFFGDALWKSERFEIFWKRWPKDLGGKGGKQDAKAAWMKIPIAKHDEIAEAIQAQVANKYRLRAKGHFYANFQHVSRWLSKSRWEDELEGNDDADDAIWGDVE